jgi:D-alanyl-D-alanine carboxypeptidase/D-alanyl-D-alanine-endopeptidase (penicillin-binding protein 4)
MHRVSKPRPWLLVVLLLMAGGSRLAAEPNLAAALAEPVRAARQVSRELGVHIVEVASGDEIFGHHPDRLRIVASNTKLFTTAAALETLGPGHFFETNVLMTGQRRNGSLRGELAVIGGGDPNISGRHYGGDSLAVFRGWAAAIRDLGVQRIEGDVHLVYGLFEPLNVHPDWPREQLGRWYEAPVEALSFNDNCVLVRVWPGRREGERARIGMTPDIPLLEIHNKTRTTGSSRRHRVIIDRPNGSNVVTITGQIYRRAAPVESWVTVPEPLRYFGAALRRAFAEEGIEILGAARPARRLPTGQWRWVTGHRSDLMTTAEVINKRSQNFFAESLLKLMGARLCGEGSWHAGRRVIEEFLGRLDIEPGSYVLADGSGMSRENRFTPRQLTHLLRHMFYQPRGREFLLTLPYSGEPGLKWEDRLAEEPYGGNVFAKTGSLNGVSTLSGYAKGVSGKIYAFAILCNKTRSNWRAMKAQDRILRVLVDKG